MAYGLKYRLDYSTSAGADIDWRLDIQQEGYTEGTIDLIGAEEPVELEYINNQDIYEPIIGSKLNINLIVTNDTTYDDFRLLHDADGNLNPRAYKVFLRYKESGDSTYSTYWVGFLTPLDFDEAFNTTPYPISLTATDGLNLVSDAQVANFGDGDPRTTNRVIDWVFDVAHQTGTQRACRVYSDIRTTIEGENYYGIVATEVNDYVYHSENLTPDKSKAEAAKDVLRAFNCVMFQSKGEWCIRSASAHLATISGSEETIPYLRFEYDDDAESWGDGTEIMSENVLVRFPNELTPAEGDLTTPSRRPYFSIERRIAEQNGTVTNVNAFLSDDFVADSVNRNDVDGSKWLNIGVGWRNEGDSTNYGENQEDWAEGDDGYADRRGSKYLSTTRTNNSSKSPRGDSWFLQGIPLSRIDYGQKILVRARMEWDEGGGSPNFDVGRIGVQLRVEPETGYNWESNAWNDTKESDDLAWGRFWTWLDFTSDTNNEWREFELDPAQFDKNFFYGWGLASQNDSIQIVIGNIHCNNNGDRVTPNRTITTKIDSIELITKTEADSYAPHYERYQDNFTETYSDEVSLNSQGVAGYRGSLTRDNFYRLGHVEFLNLEELVTLQRLNDYQTSLNFYDGTFIPVSGVVHMIDKIQQNFTGEADDVSCIIHDFSLMTRANKYRLSAYRTNQGTDVNSTFVDYDIVPKPENYSWSEEVIRTNIEIDLTGVTLPTGDDAISTNLNGAVSAGASSITVDSTTDFQTAPGFAYVGTDLFYYTGKTSTTFTGIPTSGTYSLGAAVDNATVTAGVGAYIDTGIAPYTENGVVQYGKYTIQHSSVIPGSTIRNTIDMQPVNRFQYEINAGNFGINSYKDEDDEDVDQLNVEVTDTGTGVRMSWDTITNDYSDEQVLEVSGEVDATSGTNVAYTVTKGTEPSGVTVSSVEDGSAPLGSVDFISVFYTPDDSDKEILTSNATLTAVLQDSDNNTISTVAGIQEIAYGTGVQYIVPISITSDLDDVVLTHTATTTDLADGVTTSVVNIASTEGNWDPDGDNTNDTSNWHVQDATVSVTNVVGTRFSAILEVQTDGDRYFVPDHVDLTESDSVISNHYVVFKSHQEYHIFVEGTTPATNPYTANVTVRALTQTNDPAAGNSATVTFNKGTDPSNTEVTAPGTQLGIAGGKEVVNYYVLPTSGKEIKSEPSATVTDSSSVTGTGVWIRSGTGWIYQLPFTYPDSGTATVSVSFTTTVTDVPDAVTTATVTVVGSESGGDTSNWNFADSSISVTNVAGTTYQAILEVEAINSRYITPDSVSVSVDSDATTITNTYVVFKSHTEYHVIVEGTTPSSNDTNEGVTVSVTTQTEDPSMNFGSVTWSHSESLSNISVTNPPAETGVTGTKEYVTYHISPSAGYEITTAPTVSAITDADDLLTGASDAAKIATITIAKQGTGYVALVPFTYQEEDNSTVELTFSSAAATALASDTATSTVTITVDDTDADVVDKGNPSGTFVQGTRYSLFYEAEAPSGKFFTPDTVEVSIDSGSNSVTNAFVVFRTHSEYHVYIEGDTASASTTTGNVTVTADTQDDDPALTTGQVSFTNTQSSDDGILSNITVGLPLTPQAGIVGVQEAAVYVVGPDKGYQLNDLSASDITVTNTSGSAYSSGVSVSRTGTGYIVTVPFTYASSNATVNISVDATAEALPTGTTVTKTTLTASESGSNTDEFLIADTSVDHFGVSGETGRFTFQVEAVAGYVFTAAPTVTDSLSYTGTWTAKEISKYEYHLTSDVTFADSDQTGAITISATTSDDDGEEINHVVVTPAADSDWSYVANEDPTIGVDPGDTTTFGITIEGDPGVDVSGVTLSIPDGADDWLEASATQTYVLDNSAATGKTFFFTVTGKPDPSSITLSKGGSTDEIKAITLTMFLDSTDSGIASVSKSHLKWTYSSADSGTLGSQSFTVRSNDPLYAYNSDSDFSAGEHYVYTDGGVPTQNGSSAIGTFNVTKSRSGGVFTFTVTPTIGTSDPSDGSREGYFVLAENSRPLVSASSGNIYAADTTIQSHAQNVMIGVEGVNGSWRVTRPGSDSSIVPTNPAHHNANTMAEGGTVTAAFTTNNGSTSRSVTFSLFPSSDGVTPDSGASAISTLTITQAAKDFTPKAEGDYTMVISDSDPGAGTSDDVITFVM